MNPNNRYVYVNNNQRNQPIRHITQPQYNQYNQNNQNQYNQNQQQYRQINMQQSQIQIIPQQQYENLLKQKRYEQYQNRNQQLNKYTVQNRNMMNQQREQLNTLEEMKQLSTDEMKLLNSYAKNRVSSDDINKVKQMRDHDIQNYQRTNKPYKLITFDRNDHEKKINKPQDLQIFVDRMSKRETEKKFKETMKDREYENNKLKDIFTKGKQHEFKKIFETGIFNKLKTLENESKKSEISDQIVLKETNKDYYDKYNKTMKNEKQTVDNLMKFINENNI